MRFALILLFVTFPAASLACSPPAVQLSPEEMTKWSEANPCPMDHDMEKYNKIRSECLEKNRAPITETMKGDVRVYIQPADTEETIAKCNHEAYAASEIQSQPNPDYKPE